MSERNWAWEAKKLLPHLAGLVGATATTVIGGGGGGALTVHTLAGTGGLGAYHSVSGLTAGQVLVATGAADARFELLAHNLLSGIGPNDHHNRQHGITSSADHTASGLTAGHVLRATGASAFAFGQAQHGDLGGVTANQHHNQVHDITGGDHTIGGAPYDLVGRTAGNVLGLLTPAANVSGGESAILRSATGALIVRSLSAGGAGHYVRTGRLDTAAGDMLIQPAGDLTLDPLGNDAIVRGWVGAAPGVVLRSSDYLAGFPLAGFRIGPTSLAGQYGIQAGSGEFDELRARIFVADETRVDRGQEYITKSYGILRVDFTVPVGGGNTALFYIEDSPHITGRIFSENDWIMLRYLDMSGGGIVLSTVWGQVDSYAQFSDYQRYVFTLRHRGGLTGEVIFRKGALAVNFGASGQGYILSDAVTATAPFVQIGRWAGANPYTPANRTVTTQIGRLDGVGFSGEYGLAAGVGGFTASDAYVKISNVSAELRRVPLLMFNGAAQTGFWLADGRLGLSSTDVQSIAERDFWVDTIAQNVRVGRTGTNKPNLLWDGSSLVLRQNEAPVIRLDSDGSSYFAGVMTIGTNGEIRQGTGTLGSNYTGLRLWRDGSIGRIAGYNNNAPQWYAGTDGRLYAGGGAVVLDAAGVQIASPDITTAQYMQFKVGANTFAQIHRNLPDVYAGRQSIDNLRIGVSGSGAQRARIDLWADVLMGGSDISHIDIVAPSILLAGSVTSGALHASNSIDSSITVYADPGDNGASYGGLVGARRNGNGSTPAPGALYSQKTSASYQYLYSDDAGVWRTLGGAPTNASYATGAVVGAQTSHLAAKRLMGGESNVDDVLAAVRQGAAAVRRFVYRDGRFAGQEFEGVVTDYAPRYGMDGGRALNEVTAIGDLLRAVAHLAERMERLEGACGIEH